MPKIYAIWRVFYGEDTIYNSIMSLLPYVDKVIVYYYNKPWCGVDKVTYNGYECTIPSPIDRSLDICKSIPNIEVIEDNFPHPSGQTAHLINKTLSLFDRPNYIAFMNSDFVLFDGQQFVDRACQETAPVTSTRPIQTWKYPNYVFPIRQDRMSVLTYNLAHESLKEIEPTMGEKPYFEGGRYLDDVFCFDLGFAISPTAMWYKYLLRLGVHKEITDDSPISGWYHNIWLPWHPTSLPAGSPQYGWCKGEPNLGDPYKIPTNGLPIVLRSVYE